MGTRRPNRYAGSRTTTHGYLTNLRRTDKETNEKIRKLDKQLNAFMKEPNGFLKMRKVYKMYASLDTLDGLSVKWYPRFEKQLVDKIRPTSIIAKKTKSGLMVNIDRTLTLRSLMIAFGKQAAPLVKYALKHNLTEDMKFFVAPGDLVKGHRTCNVISLDVKYECSLGNVPILPIATAVALENGMTKLTGIQDLAFANHDAQVTFGLFKYCYPDAIKGS